MQSYSRVESPIPISDAVLCPSAVNYENPDRSGKEPPPRPRTTPHTSHLRASLDAGATLCNVKSVPKFRDKVHAKHFLNIFSWRHLATLTLDSEVSHVSCSLAM